MSISVTKSPVFLWCKDLSSIRMCITNSTEVYHIKYVYLNDNEKISDFIYKWKEHHIIVYVNGNTPYWTDKLIRVEVLNDKGESLLIN